MPNTLIDVSAWPRTAVKAMQLLALVNAMFLVGCYQGTEYNFIDMEVAVPEELAIHVGDTFECFDGKWQVVALKAKPSLRRKRLVLTGKNVSLPSNDCSDSLKTQIANAIIGQAEKKKQKRTGEF